jgi:hypothetical protein
MSDTQITIIGFLLGAAVFVGYAIRLGLLRVRPGTRQPESDDEEAPPMAGLGSSNVGMSGLGSSKLDASARELKPIKGSISDQSRERGAAQTPASSGTDRIKTS